MYSPTFDGAKSAVINDFSPGGGKMRDPENEVVIVPDFFQCQFPWLKIKFPHFSLTLKNSFSLIIS